MGSSGSFGFACGPFSATWSRRVHSSSRGFNCAFLNVARLIRVCVDSLGGP